MSPLIALALESEENLLDCVGLRLLAAAQFFDFTAQLSHFCRHGKLPFEPVDK